MHLLLYQQAHALSNACCAMQVWRFILEREVEAPERFQAIQSYRATMAVLRQQAMFVEQLFDTGVVDEMEKEELLQCAPRTCFMTSLILETVSLGDMLLGTAFLKLREAVH